ncbi:MAG: DUF2959 domain-containing protein [Chthoniobacterales bacterium]
MLPAMRFPILGSLVLALAVTGCSTILYSSLEQFGIEKRDILVDRVESARDAQEDSKETFSSALEAFTDLTGYDGGDLERTYDRLSSAYDRSVSSAQRVSDRVDAVEDVGDALFREWKSELNDYSNADLRRRSEDQLAMTRRSYGELMAKMRRAEASMRPVLDVFEDQVLFLKHNLNARAVAGLEGEVRSVRRQVDGLIREMEASIAEANAFISTLR